MNEKPALMKKIRQYDFALKELDLYLDTHPDCRRALALFRKYNDLKKKAVEEYVMKYGPINPEQNIDEQHWSWVDDPWPWERS